MTILTRKYQKVFATDASNVGQIGSAQTGAKILSKDLDVLQALSAFLDGLSDVTLSSKKLPPIEEFNALFYILSYQLSYLFQQGMPEYNVSETYTINSLVKESGTSNLWKSLVTPNVGNALTEGANWTKLGDLTTLQLLKSGTNLAGIAGLTSAANTIPYFTGTGGASGLLTFSQLSTALGFTGQVTAFATSTAPSGFLECDGSAISRTTYSNLFSVIGTTWGVGNGTTTFNIPDLRGEFIRGWDHGRGIDSGRTFASSQTDAFQGHRHAPLAGTDFVMNNAGGSLAGGGGCGNSATTGNPVTDTANGTPRTASETRPVNMALMYCIKY